MEYWTQAPSKSLLSYPHKVENLIKKSYFDHIKIWESIQQNPKRKPSKPYYSFGLGQDKP